jgi:hypothetical protein
MTITIGTILKYIFLCVGIIYGFRNLGALLRNLKISSTQNLLMAIGITGFALLLQLGY